MFNISANTLTAVTGGPTGIVWGTGLLLRNSVYYIAVCGQFTNVGTYVSLYSPSTSSFVDIISQTTGTIPLGSPKCLYVDYYNNLYIGSTSNPRLYCLPANGTQWFSPTGGFTDGFIYALSGSGSVTAGASSARAIYLGGTFTSSTSGLTSLGGFARLNVTNAVSSTFLNNGFSYTTVELLVKGSSVTILWDNGLSSWVITNSNNTFVHN